MADGQPGVCVCVCVCVSQMAGGGSVEGGKDASYHTAPHAGSDAPL